MYIAASIQTREKFLVLFQLKRLKLVILYTVIVINIASQKRVYEVVAKPVVEVWKMPVANHNHRISKMYLW